MFKKMWFKSFILSKQNYIHVWIILFLIIIKVISFAFLVMLSGNFNAVEKTANIRQSVIDNPEGYISFNGSDGQEVQGNPLSNFNWLGLIFVLSLFTGFIIRMHLIRLLKKDELFATSNLNLRTYRILLFFWPTTFVFKIISKSIKRKICLTTKELIKKWKIVNTARDVLASLVLIGIATTLYFLYKDISEEVSKAFNDFSSYGMFIIIGFIFAPWLGFTLIAYPTSFISLYSEEIYNEIRIKELKQWRNASFVFFTIFIYIKGWTNILALEKELKLKEKEKEKDDNDELYELFNKETIIKFVWHIISIFMLISILIIKLSNKDSSFVGPFTITISLLFITLIYITYFAPRYISNLMLLKIKNRLVIILYIIDLFIPFISIINIIKYKKNNHFFLG